MGDSVEHLELNYLRVNEYELYLVGIGVEEYAHDYGTGTYRLTRTCSTCDYNVGHLCDIAEDNVARDVLAHGKGQLA